MLGPRLASLPLAVVLAACVHAPTARPDAATVLAAARAFRLPEPPRPDVATRARAALGRKLFHDARLSRDQATACATCHQPERLFTDGATTPPAHPGVRRHTPTVVNTYASRWLFWDGRADSLVAQAIQPLESPHEHGLTRREIVEIVGRIYAEDYAAVFGPIPAQTREGTPPKIDAAVDRELLDAAIDTLPASERRGLMTAARRAKEPEYRIFEAERLGRSPGASASWGREIDAVAANVAAALAAYERGLVTAPAAFDRFVDRLAAEPTAGVEAAFSADFGAEELAGFATFVGDGRCALCHAGPFFSNEQFHNVGLPEREGQLELGRALGMRLAREDLFNCAGPHAPKGQGKAESCLELPHLALRSTAAIGAFKTPSLRNVALTAPYAHDGRFATLAEVLKHYDRLETRSILGHRDETLRPLGFSDARLRQLEAFLTALSAPVLDLSADKG